MYSKKSKKVVEEQTESMFDHYPVSLGYDDLECETKPSGRMYVTPNGASYPSITTMLGHFGKEGIAAWRNAVGEKEADRVSRHACTRGNRIHDIAEKYLNNENDYIRQNEMPHIVQLWKPIKKILNERVRDVVLQECALYSDYLQLAGRVDLIAKFDGMLSIIDFKTSSRIKSKKDISNYFIQASAYAIMIEERTGIPIGQIVIIMTVDNMGHSIVFKEQRNNYVKSLLQKRKDFY
jgi:CRISPR/Cas system-associated exonuclease Cas4 (RecB family)